MTIKVLAENIGSKTKADKQANKQMGLHQTKKFLYRKGNHQQNKKTTHRMGEHIC